MGIATRVQEVFLSESEHDELLDQLDRVDAERSPDQRRGPRRSYRTRRVLICILDERGGELSAFRVPTRNLSHSGMSFLHKWMLAPGTTVRVHLPVRAGELRLEATVVYCRHISGMIHEVGVRFTSPAAKSRGRRPPG